MKTIKTFVQTDASGKASVQLNTEYANTKIDLIIVIEEPQLAKFKKQGEKPKYDFSEFVGKLEWKGDALEMQKTLRSEWS